jgi:hypothetical protein
MGEPMAWAPASEKYKLGNSIKYLQEKSNIGMMKGSDGGKLVPPKKQ